LRDVGNGLLEVSHNGLAFLGLVVLTGVIFVAGQPDVRHGAEKYALGWLQERHEARAERDGNLLLAVAERDAVSRATAADPRELNRQQAAVAQWLARRYRVAPEPVTRLVQEAWAVGQRAQLEPTLILAIMAVESGFNPFAQSTVGAQGLMQVMTRVHDDKYVAFGGNHAAFDPLTNLRVGVQVLKCIARAGSLKTACVTRRRSQPRRRWQLCQPGAERTGPPAAGGRRQGRGDHRAQSGGRAGARVTAPAAAPPRPRRRPRAPRQLRPASSWPVASPA
jgi:hypothetical protein